MLLTEIRTDAEYEFLKLWYSCEWITWDRYPESIFMILEGEVLFEQDWKNGFLWCKYSTVWSFFESKFGYNKLQISQMISGLLEEHLKKGVLTPGLIGGYSRHALEEHLKKGVLTPLQSSLFSCLKLEEHLKKGVLTPTLPCLSVSVNWKNISKKGVLTPHRFLLDIDNQLEEHLENGVLTPNCYI